MTVSIDSPAVEEVVDLWDDKGAQKTKLDVGGEGREEFANGGPKGVVDVSKGDVVSGGHESGAGTEYEGGDAEESGLELVGGGDEGSVVGGALKSDDRREVRRRTKEFVLGNEIEEGGGVSVRYWSPRVVVLVADDVILMWVTPGKVLGARWRRVWAREEDRTGCGRTILLVIKTCLFRCNSSRRRRLGKRDTCATSNQRGRYREWGGTGWRRLDVIRRWWVDRGDPSAFFFRLRERGVDRVRLGAGWEDERGERGLWVKGQAKSIFWRDRGRVDVTGDAGEGEEARQRASLFRSATDFALGCRGGGSRNNVSKLGGSWGVGSGEGVVGG
jgi:hypothetical protein